MDTEYNFLVPITIATGITTYIIEGTGGDRGLFVVRSLSGSLRLIHFQSIINKLSKMQYQLCSNG